MRLSVYPILEWFLGEYRARKAYERAVKGARVNLGKANSHFLSRKAGKERPPMRIVLDTQLHQLSNYERPAWYPSGPPDPNWGVTPGHYGPMNVEFGTLDEAVPYLYAIFELARNDSLFLLRLPTVKEEQEKARDKHYPSFACMPLDHDVRYQESNFGCTRLTMSIRSSQVPWGQVVSRDTDECRIELDRHKLIFSHVSGNRQRVDAWHFMVSDALGVEFFVTSDRAFLKAMSQIREKLLKAGVRTEAISPKDFCKRFGLWPINPPIADPKAAFWGVVK